MKVGNSIVKEKDRNALPPWRAFDKMSRRLRLRRPYPICGGGEDERVFAASVVTVVGKFRSGRGERERGRRALEISVAQVG